MTIPWRTWHGRVLEDRRLLAIKQKSSPDQAPGSLQTRHLCHCNILSFFCLIFFVFGFSDGTFGIWDCVFGPSSPHPSEQVMFPNLPNVPNIHFCNWKPTDG